MAESILFGPFRLDLPGKQLWRGAELISLPPRTIDVLIYLAEHAGEVLTRDELFAALWQGVFVADHALSVQIRDIRKALQDDIHEPRYIETRHRRGYVFKAPVTRIHTNSSGTEPPAPAAYTVSAPAAAGRFLPVPETRYADSGGVNIAYQVIGDGPVDLVFVMGWVSHLEYFWTEPRFARFLRRLSGFARVILFDKRGTGLSDRVPLGQLPTIEQRIEDVHAVMDKVGSARAVICGVSEGGCMSAVFAAAYPERSVALVMIGSFARRLQAPDYPWGPTPEQRQAFLQEIREHWGGPIGLEERAPSVSSDPYFRDWWATYLRMGASPGAALALTTMNIETDIRHVLELVKVPALVLHRSGDLCINVAEGRYIASKIPRARFVELPGDDHLPFVGDQESVLCEIEEFLTQVHSGAEPAGILATALVAEFEFPVEPDSLQSSIYAVLERFRARNLDCSPSLATAVFDGPARAVHCAVALQAQAARAGFRVRTGLHTGECVARPGSPLGGTAVVVASRIAGCADWTEILASGTLRDLAAGSGIVFTAHGRIEADELGEWQLLRVESTPFA